MLQILYMWDYERLCGHPCASAVNTQLRCTCRLGQPNLADQANPFLAAEIFIPCWQLFNAWNKVKSWNAKLFESKWCSMGALCYGYLKTERRGKTCEQHNELIYCLSLLWSFHFSWPFLTFPDPAHLVEVKSWPFTSAARIHGAHPLWAAQLQNMMRCDAFFFHGRLLEDSWKTLEDSSTLDKLGAT